ncbi:MAG: right-handed parallel beta-helix repeat-containing protein, partial [Candidatus Marinimicrobia bacterium]|nr:right-handed parallel beta-helix repeat-containing protein [Candidatus Neomarinimicrobiota bacterium]
MKVIKPVSIFSLILSLTANSLIAQSAVVSGYAYLEGENNHAGITVAFNAVSLTAVTDSTNTDSMGTYTIGLFPGVYAVDFSKPGFQVLVYSPEIVISGTMYFDPVTLSSHPLKTISGSVKGFWASDTTYSVIGDILVPAGDTLIIEAGTTVLFDGLYYFDVNGLLIARGSAEDSIYFTPAGPVKSPGDWYGIRFNDPADDNSILSYCVIEYGSEANDGNNTGALVTCIQASPTIEYCRLWQSLVNGIRGIECSSIISNNDIYENQAHGLYYLLSSAPKIINNNLYSNGYKGIFVTLNSESLIEQNHIYNNGDGIAIGYGSGGVVDRNSIHGNDVGIWLIGSIPTLKNNDIYQNSAGIALSDASPRIENNDVYNNGYVGISIGSNSEPTITMNIIMGNAKGISSGSRPYEVSYNVIWNNQVDLALNTPVGVGTVITVNSNGDSIDAYFNLFQDPLLVSTEPENSSFLLLTAASPCIDAGGTNLIETDTSDIGSHPYNPAALGVVPELNPKPNTYTLSPAYPNPFNPNTTINYALKDDVRATLKVYDLLGREVRLLVDEHQPAAYHSVVWDGRDRAGRPLPSGIYIARLVAGDFIAGIKMVLLK